MRHRLQTKERERRRAECGAHEKISMSRSSGKRARSIGKGVESLRGGLASSAARKKSEAAGAGAGASSSGSRGRLDDMLALGGGGKMTAPRASAHVESALWSLLRSYGTFGNALASVAPSNEGRLGVVSLSEVTNIDAALMYSVMDRPGTDRSAHCRDQRSREASR